MPYPPDFIILKNSSIDSNLISPSSSIEAQQRTWSIPALGSSPSMLKLLTYHIFAGRWQPDRFRPRCPIFLLICSGIVIRILKNKYFRGLNIMTRRFLEIKDKWTLILRPSNERNEVSWANLQVHNSSLSQSEPARGIRGHKNQMSRHASNVRIGLILLRTELSISGMPCPLQSQTPTQSINSRIHIGRLRKLACLTRNN
ncbi:hypothetical protein BpHYR1_019016 [Brachionus plicatilis]|uniref:Uncharacterized protein n=1 Tax=Brachionus plicatilis TaxID=10195 RepID=A0A3M7T9H3_BRAPC|nr:hypothetical protein BpHYR1_019016 [Brachionus plicatilis]